MPVRNFSQLQKIENDRPVTEKTDRAFWDLLQRSLLLALKEQGILTEMQYRHAAGKLQLPPEAP